MDGVWQMERPKRSFRDKVKLTLLLLKFRLKRMMPHLVLVRINEEVDVRIDIDTTKIDFETINRIEYAFLEAGLFFGTGQGFGQRSWYFYELDGPVNARFTGKNKTRVPLPTCHYTLADIWR